MPADTSIWAPVRSWVLEAEGISAGTTQTQRIQSISWARAERLLVFDVFPKAGTGKEAKREAKTKRDVERLKEKKKLEAEKGILAKEGC